MSSRNPLHFLSWGITGRVWFAEWAFVQDESVSLWGEVKKLQGLECRDAAAEFTQRKSTSSPLGVGELIESLSGMVSFTPLKSPIEVRTNIVPILQRMEWSTIKTNVLLLVSHRVNLNPIGLLRVYNFDQPSRPTTAVVLITCGCAEKQSSDSQSKSMVALNIVA